MPTTNLDQRVKRIASLSDQDVLQLNTEGITTEDDLRYIQFVDYPDTIPVVKRRKLETISQHLSNGNVLTATNTMNEIQDSVIASKRVPAQQGNVNALGPDPNRGAPKIRTDPLPNFSGDAVDYEEWERNAGAIIKQSAYKSFITQPATPGDTVAEARSMELFNMMLSSVGDGHALNTVEKVRDDNNGTECGYKAWTALKDWYMDPSQKDAMVSHWETKLDGITLNSDSSATEFINNFEMYVRKLTKLGEAWGDDKQIREFKARVDDSDFDTEVRIHDGNFADLIKVVRKREKDLDRQAVHKSKTNKRTRRFVRQDAYSEDTDEDKSDLKKGRKKDYKKNPDNPNVPFIPKFLYNTLDTYAKKNLMTWRRKVNQGETMDRNDLILAKGNDDDSESDSRKPFKKKLGKKQQGKKTRRVTKSKKVGLVDATVEVKLASSDEDYSVTDVVVKPRNRRVTFGDDSVIEFEPDRMCKDDDGPATRKIRMLSRAASIGMSKGRKTIQAYAVIDPGAEQDLIGGIGWQIMHFSDKSDVLQGALEGMGTKVLPLVDAVTAVKDEKGKVILLGFGGVAYDRRTTQNESLWNSHHMRAGGAIVNDVAKQVGGDQNMMVKDERGNTINIPLKFNDHIMSLDLRQPTEEELMALRVIWVLPPMENITPQSIRRSRIALENFQLQIPGNDQPVPEEEQPVARSPEVPNVLGKGKRTMEKWKELLAYPSEKVMEKTLEATTQLQVEPVEAERREIPKQHRKKRLLMLHPRRLPGRTDADTVFSTVKSIRGYWCIQFFLHVISDYIFVRCMQRESHSHGAYQDYVREVGAPETIITDNSQTQTGKKWEATSRNIMTKQRKFVPHNQNQSKAERRIQDVKHKTTLLLQRARAPLSFWCYALIHVVDCMNYTAKEPLGWKTPSEVLNGDTADISPFRFTFWQPIKFYDTSSFPESRWTMGRFLGIAWDTGDQFTFKVWSEPNHDWTKGREFVRNVVRTRNESELITVSEELQNLADFSFQWKKQTKKRKRGKDAIYELIDIPEIEENAMDAVNESNGVGNSADDDVTSKGDSQPTSMEVEPVDPGGNEEEEHQTRPTNQQPTTQQKSSHLTEPTPNPGADSEEEPIEMAREINDHLSRPDEAEGIGGSTVMEIVAHEWKLGHVHFKVQWSTNQTTWEHIKDMREDYPKMTARYIVENKVSRSKRGGDRVFQWAKKVERDLERAVRRIVRLYDFYLDENDDVKFIRRTQKAKKKKHSTAPVFKYGLEVPRTVDHALAIDKAEGNTCWQDALDKEIDTLMKMDCFEFKPAGHESTLDDSWQRTTLHMVFDVKQDLQRKARMVAGGHLVEMFDIQVYSSTVKSISVQLLHVISHKAGLEQLCGDIGNAFPNAYTNEKVYVKKAGPEFGKYAGCCIIIRKALYGLCSSSERFHAHLADSFRSFGFRQTRYDNDVWIRLDASGKNYEYICTHVDDFLICSKDPERVMKEIESKYLVKDSSKGPPSYYLGNDYKKDKKGRWCIGCKTYLTEAVNRIEALLGKPLPKKDTPMVDGDHPEEDQSEILNDEGHQQYQMLIGMLNWVVCIGRMDIAFSVASLSRFSACPRKGHLERVLRVFGYLKKYKNRRVVVDSRDPILCGGKDALEKDYTELFKDFYPDASEELDANLPIPLVDELEITTFADSDHAHDKVTRRSMTGLLILVGRTPVFFMSKRQGAIATSTYGAEFCAMRTATEEVISVRYMLRCLGVKVKHASLICGDNMGVIQNCTIPDSLLKKKHVAIAFHKTRESAAAGICHPIKIRSEHNFADLLTKALTGKIFWTLFGKLTSG